MLHQRGSSCRRVLFCVLGIMTALQSICMQWCAMETLRKQVCCAPRKSKVAQSHGLYAATSHYLRQRSVQICALKV